RRSLRGDHGAGHVGHVCPGLAAGRLARTRSLAADAAMSVDVSIRKTLRADDRPFELDVAFASEPRRLVLFGHSGGGKRPTMRAMAGLLSPDTGHVRVDGRTLFDATSRVDLPARERGVAYVFQDYALFPHLTVAQNIGFGLDRGWFNPRRRSRDERVSHWL